MSTLIERHESKISGVLSCFDRVVIHGTLPHVCYPEGMMRCLESAGMRVFDYPVFAQELRDVVRANAERLAAEAGCEIEFVRGSNTRKEDRVREILGQRGNRPGLVHVLSAMEGCSAYRPRYDKENGRAFLRRDVSKCLHYYFYFMDPELGLCYVRVPTWCPFRLQFYFNGHNQLAARLKRAGIAFTLVDNAFVDIADVEKAQELCDKMSALRLHEILDRYAAMCNPAASKLEEKYHWSFMQVEYATDIMFRKASDLEPLYEATARAAVLAVKAEHVATFLGRRFDSKFQGEAGNDFSTRIRGTRIKHEIGPTSIKMYDKAGRVLRIETTTNDVSYFRHHRAVEHRDGTRSFKLAELKKSIYSLLDLQQLMSAANRRYLEYISELEDPTPGTKALMKASRPASQSGRSYRGINFFAADDDALLRALARGEVNISGVRNKDLQPLLQKKPSWISRAIKRLRVHGIIKRVGHTYKYYLTELGRRVVIAGLKLRELVLIPHLSTASNSCQERA